MKAAMERGRWPWGAPLGYLNRGKSQDGPLNIVPDPERAPLVQEAFELYATGLYTQPQVLKIMHARGLRSKKGKRVGLQTFESILRNELYTGVIKSKILSESLQGTFEPIILTLPFLKG